MSRTPNFDAKIKNILDSLRPGQLINCPITKKDWGLDEKEIEICRRFQVPPCPIEPQTRMMYLNGFSNGLVLFWKPHAFSGQPILSAIHPDSPLKVITPREALESDNTKYGQEYNRQKSFLEQVWFLQTLVPFNATRNIDVDESSVAVGCLKTRNSFFACGSAVINCFYALTAVFCEDSIDLNNCEKVSRSFRVGGSQNIADSAFVFESRSCFNSAFLFDCQECENCFGATNLRHKKFVWFNEQLTEEEYRKRRAKVDLSEQEQTEEFWRQFIGIVNEQAVWPAVHGFGNLESSGERLYNCVRCHDCFFGHNSTDNYRCRIGINLENSCYASGSAYSGNFYLVTGGTYGQGLKFSSACNSSNNLEYCIECENCEYCFGCVNLRNKKFCLLNKQYTEEEYWSLVDKVKCEMLDQNEYGNFWPGKASIAGFQNSVGNLYLHYTQKQLEQFGALNLDPARGQIFAPQIDLSQAREAEGIPDRLEACQIFVGRPIFDKAVQRYFSVLKAEFEIYKNKKWPFPTEHYATRLLKLLNFSYGPIPEERPCAFCQKIITTYNNQAFPNRRVYCQDCYLRFLEERS